MSRTWGSRRTVTGVGILDRLAVGIDIGGTKVAAGVVDLDGRVLARQRRETPTTDPVAVLDCIADLVAGFREEYVVQAVGIGAAGFVDVTRSTVLFSPHLAWRHEPLRDAVQRRVRLPVLVDNDANAAAWAEWKFGAAQREPDLVCINLGTGIGGAFILSGQLLRGRSGIAGEFGHMQVVPDGHHCECGNRGCWEQYASGNAITRDARALAGERAAGTEALLAACGGDPTRITGELVTRVANEGDPVSREVIARTGEWLGVGMANLSAAFDPGVFVIGGGVSDADDLLLEPARDAYRRTLTGRGYRPEALIVRTHLRNDAGMIGAADLARTFRRRRRRRTTSDERGGAQILRIRTQRTR